MINKIFIGIDPDVDKSGFAILENGKLIIIDCDLSDVFNNLSFLKRAEYKFKVRLEAGHKDKRTWHKGGNGMAKKVGSNHEIGRQIEKFCIKHGIELELVPPQGYSSVTHEAFCNLTGWDKSIKTNPEKRVAGLLVFGCK